jgi:hypothetical protein
VLDDEMLVPVILVAKRIVAALGTGFFRKIDGRNILALARLPAKLRRMVNKPIDYSIYID